MTDREHPVPGKSQSRESAADEHHHPHDRPVVGKQTGQEWHAPKQGEWTQSMSGHKSDPLNLYVHGSLHELLDAFHKAGWTMAAQGSTKENVKYVAAAAAEELVAKPVHAVSHGLVGAWNWATHRHDHAPKVHDPVHHAVESMPMSDQKFHGQKEVASFEKGNNPVGGRHHFRIFDTGENDAEGRHVWVIAANRDAGIVFNKNHPQTGFTNHVVDPNTDAERDLVLSALESAGVVEHVDKLRIKFGARKDGTTSHAAYNIVEKPEHKR